MGEGSIQEVRTLSHLFASPSVKNVIGMRTPSFDEVWTSHVLSGKSVLYPGSPAIPMMPNGSFPRYRVDDSSYETECGHTNQCRPMEPLLRLAMQRFRCIESAGEPPVMTRLVQSSWLGTILRK